tara:strand:+ start:94278 stop:94439 length:162 start_codon:yes stop_codon:yes gene_type:complete
MPAIGHTREEVESRRWVAFMASSCSLRKANVKRISLPRFALAAVRLHAARTIH